MTTMKLLAAVLCLSACAEGAESGTPAAVDAGARDAATGDASSGAEEACVRTPKTSLEILNACTDDDVESIDKQPELPLLLEDGGLPPLP